MYENCEVLKLFSNASDILEEHSRLYYGLQVQVSRSFQ